MKKIAIPRGKRWYPKLKNVALLVLALAVPKLYFTPQLDELFQKENTPVDPKIHVDVDMNVDVNMNAEVVDMHQEMDMDKEMDMDPDMDPQQQTKEEKSLFQDSSHSNSTKETHRYRGTMYLHVGPLKTATTSIQSAADHDLLMEAAKKDGVALWTLKELQYGAYKAELKHKCLDSKWVNSFGEGKKWHYKVFEEGVQKNKKDYNIFDENLSAKKIARCKAMLRGSTLYDCMKVFEKGKSRKQIDMCKKRLHIFFNEELPFQNGQDNKKVFLSHENMLDHLRKDGVWNGFVDSLKDWDIRIIIGYRRYYEWKISMGNQIFKLYCRRLDTKQLCDLNAYSVDTILGDSDRFDGWPLSHFKVFNTHLPNSIRVVNLHEDYDMVERVFCEIIENAPNVCNAAKQYNKDSEETVQNQSIYPGYIWLAIGAIEGGFVEKPATVKEGRLFLQYVETKAIELGYNHTTLPKTCLSQRQVESVLNKTLAHEEAAVPDFFRSSKGEAALRRNFEAAVQKGKFCDVNRRETLTDSRWRDVFRHWNETLIS